MKKDKSHRKNALNTVRVQRSLITLAHRHLNCFWYPILLTLYWVPKQISSACALALVIMQPVKKNKANKCVSDARDLGVNKKQIVL